MMYSHYKYDVRRASLFDDACLIIYYARLIFYYEYFPVRDVSPSLQYVITLCYDDRVSPLFDDACLILYDARFTLRYILKRYDDKEMF